MAPKQVIYSDDSRQAMLRGDSGQRREESGRERAGMSTPLAQLVTGPGGGAGLFMCACGSLAAVARGMCAPCLARQHRDRDYFGSLYPLGSLEVR